MAIWMLNNNASIIDTSDSSFAPLRLGHLTDPRDVPSTINMRSLTLLVIDYHLRNALLMTLP